MFSCLGELDEYLSHLELPYFLVVVTFDRHLEGLTHRGCAILLRGRERGPRI